jgi:ClpP class serine protease
MRLVQLDSKALLRARASSVLAIDEATFKRGVMLQTAAPKPYATEGTGAKAADKVAVVTVMGPLAAKSFADVCGYVDGYDAIAARFSAAISNPEVGAVILAIDSPGGDVAGLEEAVASMRQARDAAGKDVFVYVDELAASAAYWIAAGVGTHVTAPGSALVGSIGCIGALVDETAALEKEGLKVTLIREPAGKAEGHSLGPVTELAMERATALVKSAAGRFYDAVAGYRSQKAKDVKALNGAVLEAPAALEAGLIDAVGGRDAVVQRAAAAISQRKKKMSDEKIAGLAKAFTGKDTPDAIEGAFAARSAKEKRGASLERDLAAGGTVADYDADADKWTFVDTKREASEKAALVKSLIDDRKVSKVESEAAWFKGMSLEGLRSYAETASSHAPPKVKDANGDDESVTVDPELQRELDRIGMSREDYLKTRVEMKKQGIS